MEAQGHVPHQQQADDPFGKPIIYKYETNLDAEILNDINKGVEITEMSCQPQPDGTGPLCKYLRVGCTASFICSRLTPLSFSF